MLCNLLHIQALLLTISGYFFTAPERLVGQNSKRAVSLQQSSPSWEQEEWKCKEHWLEHSGFLGEQAGSRVGQGKEQSCCCFGP